MNSVHNRHARFSFCILHSAFCIAALALATASASALTVTDVTASVVGYVETRDPPPYKTRPAMKTPARGWWPDPILDFQREADISGEDVQSFWLRVTCPESQAAGTYTGRIVVSAANATTATANFTVQVNDFAVGRVSPLPLAVSCLHPGIAPVRHWPFPMKSRASSRTSRPTPRSSTAGAMKWLTSSRTRGV